MQTKKYYYGKKKTHAYPDDLWEKFEIILKDKGKKQNEKMIELVSAYVEENKDIIEKRKKIQERKKPSDYFYGDKHTYAIPNKIMDKFLFVLQVKKEKQNAKIIELIEGYIEANSDIIQVYEMLHKDDEDNKDE